MIEIVDLFEKVVPLAVHGAMMSFENRKVEMVNMEIGRLREATQLINSVMASLNLPAAIEDLSGMYLLQRTFPFTEFTNTERKIGIERWWRYLQVIFSSV